MSRTVRRLVSGMRSRDARARSGRDGATGADLRLMREHNRLLVLNCVRDQGPISRVEVARRTGLSRTTVSSIMDVLLNEGLVREGSMQDASPSGGRRAILVHFHAAAGYILGVDMGRTHLTAVLADLAANTLARRSGPFDADRGPNACLPELADELRAFLDEQRVAWNQVVGVGMGMPGPMDASLHRTVSPPRMPGWGGIDVRGMLSQELGVPVYLDNDANLGALGESRFGAGVGVADLTYVKIGAGIGGGLVMSGQVYRGSRGSAGEIGHVTLDENGPLCDCGNRGCLETLASAPAIVEDARRAASLRRRGDHSAGDHAAGDKEARLDAAGMTDIAGVVQAALDGDPACRAALVRAGERIGVVLAGVVNLVNPSLILVGGGAARADDLLLEPIRRTVRARSFSVASQHIGVRVGALGDNAIALGGIAMVIDAAFGVTDVSGMPGLRRAGDYMAAAAARVEAPRRESPRVGAADAVVVPPPASHGVAAAGEGAP
jgi:glucokinase-like ROK family protein